jgi:hypothetical protein
LCCALDRIGDALVGLDAEALLAAEELLGGSMAALAASREVLDRGAALGAGRHARAALLRCRRLGASFSGMSRALAHLGGGDNYDRAGTYVQPAGGLSSLKATA